MGSEVTQLRYFVANKDIYLRENLFFWSALIFSEESGDTRTFTKVQAFFLLFTYIFRGKKDKTAKSTLSKETKPFCTRESLYFDTIKKWHAALKRLPTPGLNQWFLTFLVERNPDEPFQSLEEP